MKSSVYRQSTTYTTDRQSGVNADNTPPHRYDQHSTEDDKCQVITDDFDQDLFTSNDIMSNEITAVSSEQEDCNPSHGYIDIENQPRPSDVIPEVQVTDAEQADNTEKPALDVSESIAKRTFKLFTKQSYENLVAKELERQKKDSKKKENSEGRLVDGEIVFDEVEDDLIKITRDPKLADGQPLPEKLGRFPRELEGIPLEEIDPHITHKSFIIISKKFKRHHIFRFTATRALFCLTPWNKLRRFCMTVITNQWFDSLILTTIGVNCLFMMIQPSDPTCLLYSLPNGTEISATDLAKSGYTLTNETCINSVDYIQSVPESVFQAIYTLEMLFKMVARGIILNKHTYLRDGWNWLDFTVVIIAYVTLIDENTGNSAGPVDLTGLRAFRGLRALKSISVIPGLRTIVNAFVKSLKMLGEVMLLMLFCIAIFALLALQLYMGILRQKCVANYPETFTFCNSTLPGNGSTLCFNSVESLHDYWLQNSDNYLQVDGEPVMCGFTKETGSCPEGYFCAKAGSNPNWGFTHFDNFPWAMINTLQLVSLDFWEDTYDKVIITSGPWNMLFFLMVVLLGSFYLLNLMLAVVFMAYVQEADVEAKEEKARAKRKENTALLFDPKKLKEQLMLKQLELETKKKAENASVQENTTHSGINTPVQTEENRNTTFQQNQDDLLDKETVQSSHKLIHVKRPTTAKDNFLKTDVTKDDLKSEEYNEKMRVTEVNISNENLESQLNVDTNAEDNYCVTETPADPKFPEIPDDSFYDDLPFIDHKQERYLIQKFATLWLNKIRPDDDKLIDRNCLCCAKTGLPTYHNWMKFQNMVFKVANDGLFELFITLCIATNTIIMASEHYNDCELCRLCTGVNITCTICPNHCNLETDSQQLWVDGMPKSHEDVLENANIVFTVIFTVEAVIKLIALSKEYFSVGWNIFDLVIVALSLPDLFFFAFGFVSADEFAEVAGVIKIFRLLRIVKLAQSWSTMRNLLSIIFGAFGALVNLSLILVIIIFIFAVLGNQLFRNDYAKYEDIHSYPELSDYGGKLPRWHFYDFFHSILMVFRILCGEWIEPLWDCMRVSSEFGCTALFLSTLILGNFMILNLFLALLLNSFSTDKIKQDKAEDGDGKLKKSLMRFYHCFKTCSTHCKRPPKSKQSGSVGPLAEKVPVSHIEVTQNGKRPSIAVNGSYQSINEVIGATEGKHNMLKNGGTMNDEGSIADMSSYKSNGIELKPLPTLNGHAKSRSSSIVSELSNATIGSNGILKNRSPDISPYNLQQIERAFSTHRDQYTQFETAVIANEGGCHNNRRTPIIVTTEDFSGKENEVPNDDSIEEISAEVESIGEDVEKQLESNDYEEDEPPIAKDDEDAILDHGHIVLPDCCFAVCHKNPKLDNCCTNTWNNFRLLCARIVTHKAFEGFILLLIAASSIMLCFEDITIDTKPTLKAVLYYLNIVFAGLFLVEMVLKLFALGAKKYFTGFWSILDFVIVCVSVIDLASVYIPSVDISAFRVLRTLRALRPLRAVSRWQSMTIIVNALIFAMPSIANVLFVCLVFWLIFVIIGVQNFRGKFHQCLVDGAAVPVFTSDYDCDTVPLPDNLANYKFPPTLSVCNATILEPLLGKESDGQWHWAKLCMLMGGSWKKPFIHFDNVGAGYLALFQTATFEGWMEVMESAIDHNPTFGGQADLELSLYWYIYFLAFITFGAFFTLNLFIGVIIDKFNVLKKKYDGSYLAMFLTDNQRHYYNTLKKLGNKKPQKTICRPKNKIQCFFFDLSTDTRFEISITVIIFLNMIAMMIDIYPPQPTGTMNNYGEFVPSETPAVDYEKLSLTLKYINMVFTGIFVLEAAMKIIGLRLHYFRKAWNVFDFVVVFLSVLGILVDEVFSGEAFVSPTLLRVVRVFRIGRVLRLVKSAKGIRKLLFALVISIPALFNVATLLFLFMFIFAIIGMTFFSHVRHNDALDEFVNFETFPNSMLLLFRLSTSAGWNDILDPLMEEENCNTTHYIDTLGVPHERSSGGGDCSNQTAAVAFFVGYLFLSYMIIINMYIAVILENFSQAHEQEEIGITDDDFDEFYAKWERYDPHATQYIKLEQLSDFIDKLDAPLGISKPNGMAIVAFNLPIVQGDRIHCLDVLMSLVKRVLRNLEEDIPHMSEEHKEANEKLKKQIADKYKAAFPQRNKVKVLSTTMQRKKEDVAAKTLQRAWRNHKMKLNILRIKELAMETTYHDSLSRRLSNAFGSLTSHLSNAFGKISRRSSMRSTRSTDSHKDSDIKHSPKKSLK